MQLQPKLVLTISFTNILGTAQQEQHQKTIDFGFKTVNYDDKEKLVAEVFNKIADKYDLMNDLMSFGIQRCWKDTFIENMGPLKMRKIYDKFGEVVGEEPLKVLDIAGGTGDITFRILEKAKKDNPESKFYAFLSLLCQNYLLILL